MTAPDIPAYDETVIGPKRSAACVCIFVINEGERLRRQLTKMRSYSEFVDIVIADGGSADGSVERAVVEPFGVRAVLTKRGAGRLGAQMRMAFAWTLAQGYRGVISIDGNDKDDPEALPRFVEALKQGYDHVQGSRFVPGGVSENLPLVRWAAIRTFHAPIVSLAARFRYTDTTNGFRAYSARFLQDPRVAPFRGIFTGYELHYYLAIRAARLGFRVGEIPVARRYPPKGPVPTKISPFRGNLRVLQSLIEAALGLFDPN